MATINGFSVEPYGSPKLATYTVPGTGVRLSVRREIAPLIIGLAADFHRTVETLDPRSCWGHAPRKIAGTNSWSFHAPGIAGDFNATQHPMGKRNTFTAGEVRAIRALLRKYSYKGQPLFRWGGDYKSRADDMHFELIRPRDVCLAAVAALQTPPKPGPGKPGGGSHRPGNRVLRVASPLMRGDDVRYVQRWIGPSRCGPADGEFGQRTAAGVRWYQKIRGIRVDGVVGPQTWRQMGIR
jgi:hypothetical protein